MKSVLAIIVWLGILVGCTSSPPKPGDKPAPVPLPDSPPTKYCFVGDMGTGEEMQKVVGKHLYAENCDAIVALGDLIYSTGIKSADDEKFKERFYEPYKDLMEKTDIPWFIVLGNHDWYIPGKPGAWLELAKRHKNIYFPSFYYYVKFEDNTCLFVYDTNFHKGTQEDWYEGLDKSLFTDCKLTIAAGHHPLKSSGDHGDASRSKRKFLEKVVIGKVDLYMAGHDHQLSNEGDVKGTTLMISGAAGKLRDIESDPGVWAESIFGYMVLLVSKDDVLFQFKGLESGVMKIRHKGRILPKGLRQ